MDDELRMAARAGILLLQKNEDLEEQMEKCTEELTQYTTRYRESVMEIESLREQRKMAVLEVNDVNKQMQSGEDYVIDRYKREVSRLQKQIDGGNKWYKRYCVLSNWIFNNLGRNKLHEILKENEDE